MSTAGQRRPRPLVLVVVDGFGLGRRPESDAIASAAMPAWRDLLARWPHARLEASGEAVGLPAGQMGNSEVGHLNIGAGQPVVQDLPRIDRAIEDGSFATNPALLAAVTRAAEPARRLHLIGLVGPGGVHSVDRHAVAITGLAAQLGARDVVVHGLLDGRDTPPRSADGFVPDFEARLSAANPEARIATVGGRYYGMDRDRRWDRVASAYDAIVHARGLRTAPTAAAAVLAGYERGETDEFIAPTVIDGVDGRVRSGDVIVHFNFRADRARQLTHALVDGPRFDGFDRGAPPTDLLMVTLTDYEAGLPVLVAFPPQLVTGLAEVFAHLGWRQLHVAETEKYAHVTYFFNGGREEAFAGEERILVPSAKVATYDLQPEMSAAGVTDAIVAAVASGSQDFIVANLANPDMVGHTGVWPATVRACEFIDGCLDRIARAVMAVDAGRSADGGALICITADHGNADEMLDLDGRPVTAHSLNPVPMVLAGSSVAGHALADGVLADVAPTLLELVRVPAPAAMSGRSLLRA